MLTILDHTIVVTRGGCAIVTKYARARPTIPIGWIRETRRFVLEPPENEWSYDVLTLDADGDEGQRYVFLNYQDPDSGRAALAEMLYRQNLRPLDPEKATVMRLRLPRTVPSRYV